jgi:hypothetical protein
MMPKMLFNFSHGFYCTYCDRYFHPELDRSGLPDFPVRWMGMHTKIDNPANCPFEGKMFEMDITKVLPEAREVGKQ